VQRIQGATDTGATDTGATDTGATDTGATDTGATDTGGADTGSTAGGTDSGTTGTGSTDAGTGGNTGGDFNDSATVANPDSANVNQGDSVEIDVLANDTDASGEGLTIIGTPSSPNATITVVTTDEGTVLLYEPNFGFFGTDPFLYSVQDGSGNESTGTVTVEVEKYVDLNRNGLNDYDECGCDNLTLEVGVEGSALGSASLLSFLILTFMIGTRRLFQTRRDTANGVLK